MMEFEQNKMWQHLVQYFKEKAHIIPTHFLSCAPQTDIFPWIRDSSFLRLPLA